MYVELYVLSNESKNMGYTNENMGVEYILTYLRDKGIQCNIRIVYLDDLENIEDIYNKSSIPDFIGIGTYCNTINFALNIAKKIKTSYPQIHICLGGPQIYGFSREVLLENNFIDSVSEGEGELAIYNLVKCLDENRPLCSIPGIRTQKSPNHMIGTELINDLDSIPFPKRVMHEINPANAFSITSSRGCSGNCTYCCEPTFRNGFYKKVRSRTPESVIDEITTLVNTYGVRSFIFTDATFEDIRYNSDMQISRIYKIMEAIVDRGLDIRISVFSRADVVNQLDDKYYKLAIQAGLECFYLGIESGNDEDLKLYAKNITILQNNMAIQKLKKFGFAISFGFIGFNPYTTFQRLHENNDFLLSSGLDYNHEYFFRRLFLIPQMPLAKKIEKDGLTNGKVTYNSGVYDYHFIDKKIESFYNNISNAIMDISKKDQYYFKIDKYENLLDQDILFMKKNNMQLYLKQQTKISNLYDLLKQRKVIFYRIINHCLNLGEKYCSKEDLEQYLLSNIELKEINRELEAGIMRLYLNLRKNGF